MVLGVILQVRVLGKAPRRSYCTDSDLAGIAIQFGAGNLSVPSKGLEPISHSTDDGTEMCCSMILDAFRKFRIRVRLFTSSFDASQVARCVICIYTR